MPKSLLIGDFGKGTCAKCDKPNDELISIVISDDMRDEPDIFTFCQECLENAIGDVINEGTETPMLSERAAAE